ncbi:hypothetical protein MN086_10595 [Sulfurovum sp. XGS-02]|uniref:hypothetical protein n=1 Tax=Sulfurovum sp. XGS-02 TaxID=2925411 RepID=UPI0020454DC3|nr:hypothetical protein [Sulfurovum sp. XGS-02]UPT77482.1 hypothetical protein MN086_10595 [Sulfurovum sp. XGS-02]
MQNFEELIEDDAILRLRKQYLSHSPGTKVVVTKEIKEKNQEENVIVFRIKGTFSTNTIRSDLFWDYFEVSLGFS